ncbi:type I DNA topoisomerase [Kallipyga gabonensis]|uniref:type I DNA topoisomerase n=1 Tax=Kallipyga gabonensis TaxID=1686287 RepID=UPI0006B4F654|nr:type I DNA topoisomerase [Kallipyga gabonensis]
MTKKLVIVESPTKTKTISRILGKDYEVLASKGHLRDLPKSQFGVDIENNFEPKYINVRGKGSTINALKKAKKNANITYLATDPDREGEAISWHLAHILGMDPKAENRVSFQEITPSGVKEGIDHPRTIDMDLVDSQQGRRIMDRIVGYEISPILWKKVKSGLSAGRVQSVAVKIIVDREREIENFKPREYWTLHATHNKNKINFESQFQGLESGNKVKKVDLSTEQEAQALINQLGADFTVKSVEKKTRRKRPYPPFTTSTLQQEASRRLNFSTSKTMMVAQQLYEGLSTGHGEVGLITYMRTDSTRLSKEFTSAAKTYIIDRYGKTYATQGISYAAKKANQQDAHEAVRPTDVSRDPQSIRSYLTNDQFRLYDLIWRRALASQMKSASYKATSVDLVNSGAIFRVNGVEPNFDGFQKVWPVQEKSLILPEITQGENLKAIKLDKRQHFTQPPARYSEASLVQTLEKNGIGRPSTYAQVIKSIQKRLYVKLEDKRFQPTELGRKVNDFMEENFEKIIDINFTAQMEDRLDQVADGELDWQKMVGDFYAVFEKNLAKAKEDDRSYRIQDEPTGEKCPECGHDLVYKHGRNGKFIGCSHFPDCTFTKSIVKKIGVKCPKDGGEIIEKVSKRGKVFYGCQNYPKCDYATWDKPTGETCPKCGDLLVHRKNRREDVVICANEDCPNHNFDQREGKKDKKKS